MSAAAVRPAEGARRRGGGVAPHPVQGVSPRKGHRREAGDREPFPTPLMTVQDVVAYTRVSDSTVRRAVRDGRLRAFKLPGGLRFRFEDVNAWVESCAVEPDPAQRRGARRTLSEVLA